MPMRFRASEGEEGRVPAHPTCLRHRHWEELHTITTRTGMSSNCHRQIMGPQSEKELVAHCKCASLNGIETGRHTSFPPPLHHQPVQVSCFTYYLVLILFYILMPRLRMPRCARLHYIEIDEDFAVAASAKNVATPCLSDDDAL